MGYLDIMVKVTLWCHHAWTGRSSKQPFKILLAGKISREIYGNVDVGHCGTKRSQKIYPLVNIQKAMENHHAINGKIHYKQPFSIAMSDITRGQFFGQSSSPTRGVHSSEVLAGHVHQLRYLGDVALFAVFSHHGMPWQWKMAVMKGMSILATPALLDGRNSSLL